DGRGGRHGADSLRCGVLPGARQRGRDRDGSSQRNGPEMIARTNGVSVHAIGLAAAAFALLAAAAVLPLDAPFLFCPFRAATGLPCLTCGCTHAFHQFVRGELASAFMSSPLGTALALVCAFHLVWTLLRLCGLPYTPALQPTRALRWTALGAV